MTDTYQLSDLMARKPSRSEIGALPELNQNPDGGDLRYNDGRIRIWTARTGPVDGERRSGRVTIEVYAMGPNGVGIWKIAREYGVR